MNEFERLKMKDAEKIDDFSGKLAEIASKSAALGVSIEESKLVKKFLTSLPRRKYIHIVASLEQVLDLNKTRFEDITGRLKAYEEWVFEEEEPQEDPTKMMYTNTEAQPNQYNETIIEIIEAEEDDHTTKGEAEDAIMELEMCYELHVTCVTK